MRTLSDMFGRSVGDSVRRYAAEEIQVNIDLKESVASHKLERNKNTRKRRHTDTYEPSQITEAMKSYYDSNKDLQKEVARHTKKDSKLPNNYDPKNASATVDRLLHEHFAERDFSPRRGIL